MARTAPLSGMDWVWAVLAEVWRSPASARARGGWIAASGAGLLFSLVSYHATDPSWNVVSASDALNLLGEPGAILADLWIQSVGLAAWLAAPLMLLFGCRRLLDSHPDVHRLETRMRSLAAATAVLLLAAVLAMPNPPMTWPLAKGMGGLWGDLILSMGATFLRPLGQPASLWLAGLALGVGSIIALGYALKIDPKVASDCLAWMLAQRARLMADAGAAEDGPAEPVTPVKALRSPRPKAVKDPDADLPPFALDDPSIVAAAVTESPPLEIKTPKPSQRDSGREGRERQKTFDFVKPGGFSLPELSMLAKPKARASSFDEKALRQNAQLLETVLFEFGVRGAIDQIRPGPVVTLYELVPAPGVKHSRVVALSDDIARSMSVAACRVSVVPGRNAIGIELPNARRETVYLRDLLSGPDYEKASQALPLALGETIGGEPYIADLSKMPHLLIAGTTGSGKSVGVNAMILSILYRLPPSDCRFIMIDPKMLELSVYDGIPHLLAPVVTDPKKAIVALKWTVREMEDRYRRMSKIGVRNVAGYNERAREALAKGEHFERTVQTGFDETGRAVYESETIRPEPMPYLVVVIDEVADLMMVAGKDIEGAVQRLAQMARAAGIHLIMATQRPSVDVITGTIKANFPTRISFQVTSKIDARTILGEQGAEQLLGQGDMLYMAGGGRVTRLHGPFVSDGEVEAVAKFLRDQGEPQYLEAVTAAPEEDADSSDFGNPSEGGANDLYDQAVAIVTRDRKASTSYIQRRLQIGYNRAASLMERMEQEGVVGAANHAGKRDILAGPPPL